MTATITVAYGNGEGPEAMEAALYVLREAGARMTIETVEIGERIYHMNGWEGVLPSSWEVIRRNRVLLKAPTSAPPGAEFTDVTQSILLTLEIEALKPTLSYRGLRGEEIVDNEAAGDIPLARAQHIIHERLALFETPSSSSPVAKGRVNPSSMLLAACDMLNYIDQPGCALRIESAWRKTILAELFPYDLRALLGRGKKLRTMDFAEAIVERL